MRFFLFTALLASLFSFRSCEETNIDLDHSGDRLLKVQIDNLVYTMTPSTHKRIQLTPGLHTITISDELGKVLETETFSVVEGGLLNVAKGEYLVWTDLYGDPALRATKLQEVEVEVNGFVFQGDFKAVPQDRIFTEQAWDLGLEEDFPKELKGWEQTKEKYLLRSKLLRKSELPKAYSSFSE